MPQEPVALKWYTKEELEARVHELLVIDELKLPLPFGELLQEVSPYLGLFDQIRSIPAVSEEQYSERAVNLLVAEVDVRTQGRSLTTEERARILADA